MPYKMDEQGRVVVENGLPIFIGENGAEQGVDAEKLFGKNGTITRLNAGSAARRVRITELETEQADLKAKLDVFRDPELFALVHKLDVAMCAAEKRDLVRGWAGKPVPEWAPKERIVPWGAAEVRERYYRMLAKYAPALAAEFAEGWL